MSYSNYHVVEETVRRIEKRGKAIDLFDGTCARCGSENDLEFDHVNADREGDTHLLSQLWGSSWTRILKELEKCQLLCKSCHSLKSIYDAGKKPAQHGSQTMYSKGCRCDDCRLAHNENTRKYANRDKTAERMRKWRARQKELLV